MEENCQYAKNRTNACIFSFDILKLRCDTLELFTEDSKRGLFGV